MVWWEAGIRLLLAVLVGCVIGIERERKNRPAGMRTHVLVCVGAATIAMLETYMIADTITLNLNNPNSGIAVSMDASAPRWSAAWLFGCGNHLHQPKENRRPDYGGFPVECRRLGLAAGMGYYGLAVAGCAIVMITLALLQKLVRVNSVKNVEVKFIHRVDTLAYINSYFEQAGIKVLDIDFHVENKGKYNLYTNLYTLDMQGKTTYKDIVNHLSEYANIQSIRTRNT